jgi:cellulose synthase/poly-beta-1,6-N-acetylglucosamine synthase-like glycosyltransferase
VNTLLSILYKPKNMPIKAQNVNFVVVTIASQKVKGSLYYVLSELSKFERPVYVVVDEGAELAGKLADDFPNYHFVVVPNDFKCAAIAKGRAIEYFTRTCVKNDQWYVFLDDDSLPLDDKFLHEISHMEKEGYVAANGNLYPRPGRNIYTYVIDHFRFLDDITFFRACQGFIASPICGFHGELLIVKGLVLKEIGFNRRSLTEDFSFAMEVVRRKYKVWHSQTKVSIQSPNNLRDLLRQRARWFKGILLDLKEAPIIPKIIMGLHLGRVILSFSGSFVFMVLWLVLAVCFGLNYIPFIPTFMAGTVYWFIGVFILPKAPLKHKLLSIPLSVIEVIHPLYAAKIKDFAVIDKN